MNELRSLWLRLGVTLSALTEEEATAILRGDHETLNKVLKDGRAAPDGDAYIPGFVVDEYGKKFSIPDGVEVGDVNFDLDLTRFIPPQRGAGDKMKGVK